MRECDDEKRQKEGPVNNVNTFNHPTGFKCMYTNADSLLNKFEEFKTIIKNAKPLVIGITEIKPKNNRFPITSPEISLPGYDMFHTTLNSQKGRGCILYARKDLGAIEEEVNSEYSDQIWCRIRLNNEDSMLVGCIYRSPNSDKESDKKLNSALQMISEKKHTHMLVMGDFNQPNINWATWTGPSDEPEDNSNTFIEQVRDCFWYQHVTRPTRARGSNTPNLLDLLFTNEEGMISDIEYMSPLGKSDHSILMFQFNCYLFRIQTNRTRYRYDKGDYESLNKDLDLDWNHLLRAAKDTDEIWTIVKEKIKAAIDKNIPKSVISGKNNTKTHNIQDRKVLALVRKKHRAWNRYLETRQADKYRSYCKIRNKVRKLSKESQIEKEKEIANSVNENPKKFWNYTKSKTKVKPGISDLEYTDGNGEKKTTIDDSEKAEVLSDFFSSVFTEEGPEDIPHMDGRQYREALDDIKIDVKLVEKKLAKLKPCKSPGPDNIHPKILREASKTLCYPLSILFQDSLDTGKIPEEWKIANVSAIFKKGNKKKAENYRPVSLTSTVCKLMESIIRDSLVHHLKANNLLSNKQFGFISGRSTTLQLLKVLENWTKIIDEGGTIDTIYMDYMKAFDKVPHKRLNHKIDKYGIIGKVGRWIEEFLKNRRQHVVVNGKSSSWQNVTSGIPQGSVIGPVLFILYINDLPDSLKYGSNVYLFADDTKIYKNITSENDCKLLQKDLDILADWSNKWLLRFHPDKCKVLEIGTKAKRKFEYKLHGQNLAHVTSEKDIGVIIDDKLSFEQHISEKINKANSIVGIIRRSFKYLTHGMFTRLFKALVRPHIEYANTVWNPHLKKFTIALENVQRRATKLLPGMKDLSYPERLRKLKLPTLVYRRLRGDMVEVFKILNGHYDREASNGILCMNADENPRDTRGHTRKLYKRRARLNIRQKFFSYRVVDVWNDLPQKVIDSPSTKCFESRLDKFWQNQDMKFNFKAVWSKMKKRFQPGDNNNNSDDEEIEDLDLSL